MKSKITIRISILLLILLNIGCDQVTKSIARNGLEYHQQVPVIKNYFTLVKVENSGAFLSSGDNWPAPIKFALLNLLPVVIMIYGIFFLMTKIEIDRLIMVGVSCIVGGGIGNLYDRMVHGSVTDFMHMDFLLFQTGVFNVADLSIMLGIFILLYHNISTNRRIGA
ncbi:MAG: signal peptidase II [Pedobacter sp.]|nr:MAG: signal peptidase II [Pedobacter sp.]